MNFFMTEIPIKIKEGLQLYLKTEKHLRKAGNTGRKIVRSYKSPDIFTVDLGQI